MMILRNCVHFGLNLLEILIRENEWERGDTSNVLRCQWKYFVYCYNCMFTLCFVMFLWRCKCNCETAWVQTSSVLNCDVKLTTLCHYLVSHWPSSSALNHLQHPVIVVIVVIALSLYATKSADVQMQIMNFCIFHTIHTCAYLQHSLFVKSLAGRLPSRARCRHSGTL